jgi:hypothetical protein
MNEPRQFWFPALKYGWGWGLPITWQGWVAFAMLIGLLVAGGFLFPMAEQPLLSLGFMAVVILAYGVVLAIKGEPTKWRWGKNSDT